MKQYLDLLKHILKNGVGKSDRTGTGTKSVFGYQMRFNLQDGFPLVTTKKMHTKSIIHELLWFIKGETNVRYLKENDVSIWDEWADESGELGPIYGKQWRKWDNLTPKGKTNICNNDLGEQKEETLYENKQIDQISLAINQLKIDPDCRRIIVSAWNVADIQKMKLAPCHCLFQFYTNEISLEERENIYLDKYGTDIAWKRYGHHIDFYDDCEIQKRKLSCQLYQRSCDVFLGVPFNIASYALLTMMIAQCVNMLPHEFIWTGGDTHIYSNHFEQVKTQLSREPFPIPLMKINPEVKDIFSFKYDDFTLENYQSHPSIKAPIAV